MKIRGLTGTIMALVIPIWRYDEVFSKPSSSLKNMHPKTGDARRTSVWNSPDSLVPSMENVIGTDPAIVTDFISALFNV